MRRTPLARKTPLEAKTALKRTTALSRSPLARSVLHAQAAANQRQPKPKRRTPPTIPSRVRIALAVRSGGLCEIAAPGCTGTATDFSHRKKTGAGGRKGAAKVAHDVLSNALHACRTCHGQQLHAEPKVAYAVGWMLREHQNPITTPVLRRGTWVLLGDNGAIIPAHRLPEEAAA